MTALDEQIKSYGKLHIENLDFILEFMAAHHASKRVKSIKPYSFTIGSNHHGENLSLSYGLTNSLFYGKLQLCINPNDAPLAPEKIQIKYRSYLNHTPYDKYITRIVEKENLINEASDSLELFDNLQVTQQSNKYDFYFTFIGFKIDLI